MDKYLTNCDDIDGIIAAIKKVGIYGIANFEALMECIAEEVNKNDDSQWTAEAYDQILNEVIPKVSVTYRREQQELAELENERNETYTQRYLRREVK